MKQFIILEWIKLLWNRLSLWAGLYKCSWNKIITIQWRQLTNMSDLTVLSACLKPISMAAHKCQISQCYQPVWNRYRWQLTNMSDLTVLSACLEPISMAAHKYVRRKFVRPHSVISLLRPDIELRQLTDMSHLTVLAARWDPIPKTAHKYVRPHSVISLLRPDTEGSSQMSDLTVLSACWDPISKSAHKYVRPHSVISLLRPDIEGSSQICQTSQRYQPVETRYRRQLTNISDFIVLSACWDTISHCYQCT